MMDVRREQIPLLWSTVGETASAKAFCSDMGIQNIYLSAEEQSSMCVCVKTDTVLGMYLFDCIVCDGCVHVCEIEIEKQPSCSYMVKIFCLIVLLLLISKRGSHICKPPLCPREFSHQVSSQ